MLTTIFVIVVSLIIIFAVIVSLQPAKFRIARSSTIHAPAAVIFDQVNDFHNWSTWSPWEKLDPAMTKTFDGPSAGVGAIYHWEGNKQVGKGTMTLLESRPTDFLKIQVQFFIPFKATNIAEFTFISDATETVVTWAMLGEKNFVFKAMYMVMPMDKMIGKDFDKGLAELKALSEAKTAM